MDFGFECVGVEAALGQPAGDFVVAGHDAQQQMFGRQLQGTRVLDQKVFGRRQANLQVG